MKTNEWKSIAEMNAQRRSASLINMNDNYIYVMNGKLGKDII